MSHSAENDALEIWDGSVAPGGYVCGVCGIPVESEPCATHDASFIESVAREVHALKFPSHQDCPPGPADIRNARLHILALAHIIPPEKPDERGQ